jgi:glycosyltransferase involved in cell wall biosynthesis
MTSFMSRKKEIIFIVHPGKANYPEIAAYTEYFTKIGFFVSSGTKEDYAKMSLGDKKNSIVWCIMGFYPEKFKAKLVIHDYRSLSVGSFVKLKDKLKRDFQPRADIRIFQTAEMEEIMAFRDGVRTLMLPMGVPDWIFSLNDEPINENTPSGTFCYIGEITRERRLDEFVEGFCRYRKDDETLILVGDAEKIIYERYISQHGVVFTGRLPQREALAVVRMSQFAVSTIPHTRPYNVQAPTKLLEYAALGKKVLCNNSPSNINSARKLGIDCLVADGIIFDKLDRNNLKNLQPNDPEKLQGLKWKEIIRKSEIESFL